MLLDLLQLRRHARLAEILLGEDVRGHLAELLGDVDSLQPEDDRAVRVLDLARRLAKGDRGVGALAGLGVAALELHAHLEPILDCLSQTRATEGPASADALSPGTARIMNPASI